MRGEVSPHFTHSRAFAVLLTVMMVSPFLLVTSYEPAVHGPRDESARWYIYIVDELRGPGRMTSLAVDSNSDPHIAYFDGENRDLKYARWDGVSWQIEIVDSEGETGWCPSIVLDSQDNVHIAYHAGRGQPGKDFELRYALLNESLWKIETIDGSDYGVGFWPSIALDSKGYPHVSYLVHRWPDDFSDLRYGSWNGTSWEIETVEVGGVVGFRSSLTMDLNDYPHVSYDGNDGLSYAHWNGSSWVIENVASPDVGFISIGLDINWNPQIAFTHSEPHPKPGLLKYARWSNGTWEIIEVDAAHDPGLSLVLEFQEIPHISYYGADKNLRHAYQNDGEWKTEIVDNGTDVGARSSMTIDSEGDLHVSYADFHNTDLKYASTRELLPSKIETLIDVDPDTLNLKSKGKFITAYIELEGADVRDINASSILLNDVLSPILDTKYGFVTSEDSYIVDNDQNGIMERMVKFDRSEVQKLLAPSEEVVITITGSLYDGTAFEGSDTIRVIDPR